MFLLMPFLQKRFKRLRRIQEEESDGEDDHVDEGLAREAIAEQLFDDDEVCQTHRVLVKPTSIYILSECGKTV